MTASGAIHDNRPVTTGRSLHVAAVALALAVFPLIVVGAGVTSKDAGMAYPDGFTSAGYVLRNPPGWWDTDDTRWEHGHRLLGRLVGVLAIVVAVMAWRRGGAIRAVGMCTLAAICVQGVLGALRVNEISTGLAMVHGIFGQLCFCLACLTALMSGRRWQGCTAAYGMPALGALRRLCVASCVCVLFQLVLGAALRHFGSQGALLGHVLWAMVVTMLVGWAAMWVTSVRGRASVLAWLGWVMAGLLALQLLLGGLALVVTVFGGEYLPVGMQWAVPSAHVAVGALMFADMILITACCYRMLRPAEEAPGTGTVAAAMTS